MTRTKLVSLGAFFLVLAAASTSQAGWRVGIGIGIPFGPGYYPGYYYPPPYYYYPPPPPVVIAPPVQVVSPPATIIRSASPITPEVPYQAPAPTPAPELLPPPAGEDKQAAFAPSLEKLRDPNEQVRADTVMQLGRQRVAGAVDAITVTLKDDSSPVVREAAARALGLIGSRASIPALQRASLADTNAQVRSSARYAVEVVNSR
jgi:hypothetical protein